MKKKLTTITIILLLCSLFLCTPTTWLSSKMAFADAVTSINSAQQPLLKLVNDQYIKETRKIIMDFDAPMPVERNKNCIEAWQIRTFDGYKQDLRDFGARDEALIGFGSRML